MNPYQTRGVTLDPGVTALALRGLQGRPGHYPFIARVVAKRRCQNLVVASAATRRPAVAYLAVVQHGNDEVFRKLTEYFRGDPDVQVIWDRRAGERRSLRRSVGADRRRGDRRSTIPFLWENADYVLVPRARRFAQYSRLRSGSSAWLGSWRHAWRLTPRWRPL